MSRVECENQLVPIEGIEDQRNSDHTRQFAHDATMGAPLVTGTVQLIAGVIAGFIIGIVASLLGVSGGELLIPTLDLLFGADIKLARRPRQRRAVSCRRSPIKALG